MSDNEVDWQLLGMTFELGQAVVYHEGTAQIEGLVDGQTYYVITGINEFDLQGDNRFVQHQIIQLAETEMEARAGVNISFSLADADATGFSLEAKHLLDSGFSSGLGVLADLKAEDKSSAEAGVENDDPWRGQLENIRTAQEKLTNTTGFDAIVSAILAKRDGSGNPTDQNVAQDASASAGVQGKAVKVAGALAFSYADHDVTTDVGGTAVLKSNENLEIKATIDHSIQLSAETSLGKPEAAPGDSGSTDPSKLAVSLAVDVGIFNTDAEATVESGAQLDALCATRVISLIQHPYLTSPDEFFPSTLGEFLNTIKSEGYEATDQVPGRDPGPEGWALQHLGALDGRVGQLLYRRVGQHPQLQQHRQFAGRVGRAHQPGRGLARPHDQPAREQRQRFGR